MKEKGLDLKVELKKDIPESILSDLQRVQQIVKNLFSNAIKFTKTGEIKRKLPKLENSGNFWITCDCLHLVRANVYPPHQIDPGNEEISSSRWS